MHELMGPPLHQFLPPGQFGGKQFEAMPGADANAIQVRSVFQDKADLHLGIAPGQTFERMPHNEALPGRPVRIEQTAPTVTPNAFDLAARLKMGVNFGGVYMVTLEQTEREGRNEGPLTRQILTTPIAPLANQERSEFADPTQVYLI